MKIQDIKKELKKEDIERILKAYGVNAVRGDDTHLVFPTICHNDIKESASAKLFYYTNTGLFTCFTECEGNFDIIDLIVKIHDVSFNEKISVFDAVFKIDEILQKNLIITSRGKVSEEDTIDTFMKKKNKKKSYIEMEEELSVYSDFVLDIFSKNNYDVLTNEGITEKAIERFEIAYYDIKNALIFPWRNIDGDLLALKGRMLDWTPGSKMAKYLPLTIQTTTYANRLSLMLYGIWQNKKNIEKSKTAFLFEGEKSVLKCDALGYDNCALAIGGQTIHDHQIEMLLKLNVRNVVICLDKDYDSQDTFAKDQYTKLYLKKAEPISPFFNVSVILDHDNLLQKKDSPIDQGAETFEKLFKNKINLK